MPRAIDPTPLTTRPSADRDHVLAIIAAGSTPSRGLTVHAIEPGDDGKLHIQLSSGRHADDAIRLLRIHGYAAEWEPRGDRGFRKDSWVAVAGKVDQAA